jgi:SAM-dependent methyltransferase
MSCYLCESDLYETIHKGTRDNPNVDVVKCGECGLVYLLDPPATDYASGEMYEDRMPTSERWKATSDDDDRRLGYLSAVEQKAKILDYGCGAGGLLSKAKRDGKDITGLEVNFECADFLKADGHTVYSSLIEVETRSLDVVTMFHVLEHLPDPIGTLEEIASKIVAGGSILIEVPSSDDRLLQDCPKFADFSYWSKHLYLFNKETLSLLLIEAGFDRYDIYHVQRYGLANHLRRFGNEGAEVPREQDANYRAALVKAGRSDTILANVRGK